MLSFKIRNKLVFIYILLHFFSGTLTAQTISCDSILNNLYHLDDSITYRNEHYLILTNKNCYACFSQLCSYLPANEKVNLIVVMDKNYLALLPTIAKHRQGIKCINEIFFLFTEKCVGNELEMILKSPSPQLVFYTNGKLQYKSYKETMKMIK